MKKIKVQNYHILPGDRKDTVFGLRKLLESLEEQEEILLEFPKGEYHFYEDYAFEELLFIPNHEEDTIKKVAFLIKGKRKFQIEGNGSRFIFHTELLPFVIRDSAEVCIRDLEVDYERPGYSQGRIESVSSRQMKIRVDKEKFPYYVRGKRLYFTGEHYCHELVRWMELDGKEERPVYGLTDRTFNLPDAGEAAEWKELEPGLLEVTLGEKEKPFEEASKHGDWLILRHHPRNAPAFYVENSRELVLRDIRIYHSLAMGVLAQRAENMLLERVHVMRHPEKKHVFSAEADALHFVSCRGKIHIKDCLLENQLDDPVNIHGIYGRVKQVLENGSFLVELVHPQQKGARILEEGERFRFVDNETMLPAGETRVLSVKRLNRDFLLVVPEDEGQRPRENWAVENLEWSPEVLVEGCTMRNNRARGILVTSAGEVVIRENVFQVPGAAVLIEGDCNEWFESGAIRHVVIERNRIENCAYVPAWGKAPIQISPGAPSYMEGKAYHGTVEIRNNQFLCSDDRLLWARNVDTILWEGNRVEKNAVYPPISGEAFPKLHVLHFKSVL